MQGGIPVGSTFNIQNFIPHKSQKTKAVSETNRAKEFQRGTAGAPESAEEGTTGLPEGSDIGLGQHFQTFESHIPDQTPLNEGKKGYKAAESSIFSSPLSAGPFIMKLPVSLPSITKFRKAPLLIAAK